MFPHSSEQDGDFTVDRPSAHSDKPQTLLDGSFEWLYLSI
jgi:hypothetical protein